ncbi:MAG: SH3 domain-containing protein [bacterium]|nr:SH3 domain-containing protein [bacterium]
MRKSIPVLFLTAILLVLAIPGNSSREKKVLWTTAKNGLRLRESPSLSKNKICSIPYNTKVFFIKEKKNNETVAGKTARWIYIKWGSKKGWVFGAWLSFHKDKKYTGIELLAAFPEKLREVELRANNTYFVTRDCFCANKIFVIDHKKHRINIFSYCSYKQNGEPDNGMYRILTIEKLDTNVFQIHATTALSTNPFTLTFTFNKNIITLTSKSKSNSKGSKTHLVDYKKKHLYPVYNWDCEGFDG